MRFDILFFNAAFFLYIISITANFIFAHNKNEKIILFGYVFVVIGFFFHSASLLSRFFIAGHVPFSNLYESLVFFAWTLIIIYFILSIKYRFEILGSFILPLVFLCLLYAGLSSKEINIAPPALESNWLKLHVAISFFGYATFALAFSTGLMYLIQEHYFKAKRPAPFHNLLPSLEILDELNNRLILIGFPLFTVSIGLGMFWANQVWGHYWNWAPQVIGALITWLIYVIYLVVRHIFGWRGKKLAYLSIIGFWTAIFTYLGIKGLHYF
ncbi:MAG: c-type cytochrome biogenesis protein CcsB [bacterium]